MPSESKSPLWKRVVGYSAFTFFALFIGLFLTFPYDTLKQRVQGEAEEAGLYVRMGSLGPGLFGVTARDIELSKRASGNEDKPPEPLKLASVTLRPSIFPPGIALSAHAFDGVVHATIGGLSDVVLRVDFDDLDLSKGNLKGFSGVDLSGKAAGKIALALPKIGKAGQPDLSQATGSVQLSFSGLTVNGGSVKVPIAMYGPDPTPIDLPKLPFGDLDGRVKFDKGQGTLEQLTGKGQGLELGGSGTLKLGRQLDSSEANLDVRLKTDPAFVKSLGLIGSGLSMLRPDPKDPNWRTGKLTGFLGRPNFR